MKRRLETAVRTERNACRCLASAQLDLKGLQSEVDAGYKSLNDYQYKSAKERIRRWQTNLEIARDEIESAKQEIIKRAWAPAP